MKAIEASRSRCLGFSFFRTLVPSASACIVVHFALGREDVVVHPNHHRNKHDGVIEKMQLHAREEELQYAHRHRSAAQIVMQYVLRDEQQMLNVMPELNHQRDRPPRARSSAESLAQHPEPNQHHQSIAIVQHFRFYQPRVPQSHDAVGHWPRPAHYPNLVSLHQMLTPMRQHYKHKDLQGAFVPHRVQLVVEAGTCRRSKMSALDTCPRSRHYQPLPTTDVTFLLKQTR